MKGPTISFRRNAGTYPPSCSPERATVAAADWCVLPPLERGRVSTGLRVSVPAGWRAFVVPLANAAWERGLTVLDAPSPVPEDGDELRVLLMNLGGRELVLEPGEDIAQIEVRPAITPNWQNAAVPPSEFATEVSDIFPQLELAPRRLGCRCRWKEGDREDCPIHPPSASRAALSRAFGTERTWWTLMTRAAIRAALERGGADLADLSEVRRGRLAFQDTVIFLGKPEEVAELGHAIRIAGPQWVARFDELHGGAS